MADDLETLRTRADDGDPVAMWRLGDALTATDPPAAEAWFRRSAELDDRVGMYRLASALLPTRPHEARTWFERGYDAGDTAAGCQLGDLIADEDPERARSLWEAAAEGRYAAAATHRLGRWWATRDPSVAVDWFRRAYEAGDLNAMSHLARLLYDVDPVEAERWRARIEDDGDPRRLVGLAADVANLGQTDRAIALLERASAAGRADALRRAGRIAIKSGDARRGRGLLERAAGSGDATAMAFLFGQLLHSNRAAAWAWARQVERSESPEAWVALANELRLRRPLRSRRLLKRAAAAGDPHARGVLAARSSWLSLVEGRVRPDASVRQAQRREWAAQGAAAGNALGLSIHILNLLDAGDRPQARKLLEQHRGSLLRFQRVLLDWLCRDDKSLRAAADLLTAGLRRRMSQISHQRPPNR